MNAERLLALANYLDTVPPEKFNFEEVVDPEVWKGGQRLECGACACAIGYMPLVPEFKELGLYYSWTDSHGLPTDTDDVDERDTLDVVMMDSDSDYVDTGYRRPSFVTADIVFDLDREESNYLFSPQYSGLSNRATASEVAAHIRAFVARGGMP